MACRCPSEVFSDIDNLPKPALYTVQRTGACLDDDGSNLYGVVRKTSGGTVYKLLAWPYPALGSYSEIATSSGVFIGYPCVVGADVFWIDSPTGQYRVRKLSGATETNIYTFTVPANGGGLWGLRYHGGYLWVAYYAYDSGSPTFQQRTGWIRIDVVSLIATEFEFSDAPDNGLAPHFSAFQDTTVATDGGLWAYVYSLQPSGNNGLARLDPVLGTYQTTDDTYSFEVPHPVADGRVRSVDAAPVADASYLIGSDMGVSSDDCDVTVTVVDRLSRKFVAWNADFSTVIYSPSLNDKLMVVSCPAINVGGWMINALSIRGASAPAG